MMGSPSLRPVRLILRRRGRGTRRRGKLPIGKTLVPSLLRGIGRRDLPMQRRESSSSLSGYEVPKAQGPEVKPHKLTGEERFYLKKVAQKKLNYVPIGRRGVFGGVILNMHMHWKKHETVKVICKPCKPGQVHEFSQEIARLSGGIPINIIGDDTVVFYRGKKYVQPEVMSPIDTLSKKKVS
ncbi:Uncharacterized CRM domain-containing protein At3g25440, chloroplastic [Linum perenne]